VCLIRKHVSVAFFNNRYDSSQAASQVPVLSSWYLDKKKYYDLHNLWEMKPRMPTEETGQPMSSTVCGWGCYLRHSSLHDQNMWQCMSENKSWRHLHMEQPVHFFEIEGATTLERLPLYSNRIIYDDNELQMHANNLGKRYQIWFTSVNPAIWKPTERIYPHTHSRE
jgi:hypothetical protein